MTFIAKHNDVMQLDSPHGPPTPIQYTLTVYISVWTNLTYHTTAHDQDDLLPHA